MIKLKTPDEIEQMAGLLRDGLRAGGFGFSTTTSTTHNDGNGDPVPSRFAGLREFVRPSRRICRSRASSRRARASSGSWVPRP